MTAEDDPLDDLHFDSNLMDTAAVSVTAAIQRIQLAPEKKERIEEAIKHLDDMLERAKSVQERLEKLL